MSHAHHRGQVRTHEVVRAWARAPPLLFVMIWLSKQRIIKHDEGYLLERFRPALGWVILRKNFFHTHCLLGYEQVTPLNIRLAISTCSARWNQDSWRWQLHRAFSITFIHSLAADLWLCKQIHTLWLLCTLFTLIRCLMINTFLLLIFWYNLVLSAAKDYLHVALSQSMDQLITSDIGWKLLKLDPQLPDLGNARPFR